MSGTVTPPVIAFVDTKQLLILKFLTAHLEGLVGIDVQARDDDGNPLTNTDGSPLLEQTTLEGRIFRGRTRFGDEMGGAPFLSILEGKKPDELPTEVGSDKLVRDEAWHLLIQGFMQDDDNNPTDNLYRLKGMVERRLAMLVKEVTSTGLPMYPTVYRMGGLIMDMTIGPGIVRPFDSQTGGVEAFYLPISVIFVMNVDDPFTVT